jgi:hypothetical protein
MFNVGLVIVKRRAFTFKQQQQQQRQLQQHDVDRVRRVFSAIQRRNAAHATLATTSVVDGSWCGAKQLAGVVDRRRHHNRIVIKLH